MGNILNDIVDEIDVRPNKSKLILKWTISIAGTLIALAFVFGQFKASFFNRMDDFETTLIKNSASITALGTDMDKGFDEVDTKIDKIYTDALTIFNNFQSYNNAQLGLIIDYSDGNKDMLKRMLEINTMKQQQELETRVEKAKKDETPTYKGEVEISAVEQGRDFSIGVTPLRDKPFISELFFIEVETNDTTFNIKGATQAYINGIDKNKYELGAVIANDKYANRYDFSYRKKRR